MCPAQRRVGRLRLSREVRRPPLPERSLSRGARAHVHVRGEATSEHYAVLPDTGPRVGREWYPAAPPGGFPGPGVPLSQQTLLKR